jgi:hypothetical protein
LHGSNWVTEVLPLPALILVMVLSAVHLNLYMKMTTRANKLQATRTMSKQMKGQTREQESN